MTDNPTDQQLLSRLPADDNAMRLLVDRHGAYLFGVAHALLSEHADADDAVQETFLAAMKSRFDGRSSVRTWLVGIVVRQAALLRRKRLLRLRIARDAPPPTPRDNEAQSAVDARLDLAVLLEQLSPEHREVLVMRELQGMPYEQIARALGVAVGTVESRLSRARQQLRQQMQGS